MKTSLIPLSTFVVISLALGCGPRGPVEELTPREERPAGAVADDNDRMLTLADYLRQIPGVVVSGSGANTVVEIHGVSSFYLSSQPLYVVDGQDAGTSYAHVASLVPAKHIDYVRVLKGSDATLYGARGGNGVILIVTKK